MMRAIQRPRTPTFCDQRARNFQQEVTEEKDACADANGPIA